MSARSERLRTALVGATCLALLAVGVGALLRDPALPAATAYPSLQELDSLRRYLAPVAAAPPLDDYDMYLPAEAGRAARAEAPRSAAPADAPRLSAILISGEHPLAIIDDRPVRRGERLSGGAEVVTIARDHVVIREPGGALRTLRLAPGQEGPDET